MNKLSELFLEINNGDVITLENNGAYDVAQDDSFVKVGYFCSNTAKKDENPYGLRFSAIYLKDKKDIVIDGNGSQILIHGKMTPILLDNCENITIKNLTIDYACPTMSEFRIVANNNGECILKINKDCLFDIVDNQLFWHGEKDSNGKYYWRDTNSGFKRHIKLYNPVTKHSYDFNRDNLAFESIEIIDELTLKIKLKNKDVYFPEGHVIQSRSIIRDQTGSMFQRCKNLCFENLRIKFMHGLGMVSQYCENVSFMNCDFTPADGRTVASTADFFQFSGCKGDIIIENCKAYGAHDDYVNVHGTHLRIIEANYNENKVTIRFMHPESWGFQAFERGDTIDFIKWDTLKPYYTLRVVDFKKINDTDISLTLDNKLPDIEINKDVLENATFNPDLYIKNCSFGQTAGRGILCTTRGKVVIENNLFENLWGPALLIEDDCNFWFESGYTTDVTFRNNRVICCDYHKTYDGAPVIRYTPKVLSEEADIFVHGKLTVENNVFENPCGDKHLFHLEHLKEVIISDNVFDNDFGVVTEQVMSLLNKDNIVKK